MVAKTHVSTVTGIDRAIFRGGRRWRAATLALAASAVLGCSAGNTTSTDDLPAGVQDPTAVRTPGGALSLYHSVTTKLMTWDLFEQVVLTNGVITDELAVLPIPLGSVVDWTALDSRTDPTGFGGGGSYGYLHRLRADAREARNFLLAYAPDSSPALAGHMYAIEGYTEILLADLFCSGIPLSTVDFDADYTLAPGSSTAEVYTHAVALFDTAASMLGDSTRLQPFGAVGRGRALLALGRYADAGTAVAAVPDDYTYQLTPTPNGGLLSFASTNASGGSISVPDREGINGLDYRSSGDPRVVTTLMPNGMYFPMKYDASGPVTLTLASGVEARLIEAEAALQTNPDDGQWLAILNHLRQTAWPTIVPAASGSLPDLADPSPAGAGLTSTRVDLLFRERAFWLYLTAHRQGDLRRLIRQYGREPNDVYPTGAYPGGSGAYGSEIVVQVPQDEQTYNPNYTGCINRNA